MKKMILSMIIVCTCLIVGVVPVHGCIGSRAESMGWAGVACPNDATATYWNPALLPLVKDGIVLSSDVEKSPYIPSRSISAKYKNIGFSSIKTGRYDLDLIALGLKVTDNFYIGGSVGHNISPNVYNGIAYSFSATYILDSFTFALLYQTQGNNFRPSIAYQKGNLVICTEAYNILNESINHLRLGAEYKINNLAFRYGINDKNIYNWKEKYPQFFGIGFEHKNFYLDFSTTSIDYINISFKINY